jgi:hypothetical protein
MRLRPLVIALVVWTASLSASFAAETSSGSLVAASSHPVPKPGDSSQNGSQRAIYLGVMGEVAHPAAYAARADWTLTELIKRAGGITPHANKTVRIFRGGLLTEQVFLGSGEAPALSPNDLIVVGSRGPSGPRMTPVDASRGLNEQAPVSQAPVSQAPVSQAPVSAVQIAFVGLIDRPVIVKMPGDQATLARIVELLGQPADCAAKIRLFAPLGAGPRDADSIDQATRPLDSGTVLVFSPPSIRLETLPALPEPIAEISPQSSATPTPRPPDSKRGDSNVSDPKGPETLPADPKGARSPHPLEVTAMLTVGPEEADHSVIDRSARPPDITLHAEPERARRPLVPSDGATQSAMIESVPARSSGEPHRDSHAGRMVALMAVMSAVAGLAMLLTFVSIVQRWMESGKLPFRRQSGTASRGSSALSATASVPIPAAPAGLVGRPIRIDAGQPITRLSVDLAAIERAPHSTSVG